MWTHLIHNSTNINTKYFANVISYTLTDFHCTCRQPMVFNGNHERTPFVDYVVFMFKYLAKETGTIGFGRCEKLVETQKYSQIAAVDYIPSNIINCAHGLGRANNFEALFIESSSGILLENVNYTLEDTLKLIVECNGALCYILSCYKYIQFETALENQLSAYKL